MIKKPRALWGDEGLSAFSVKVEDGRDGAIVVQSTCGPLQRMPRLAEETFSFGRSDLVQLTNTAGDQVSIRLAAQMLPQLAIQVSSNRRGAFLLRSNELERKMRLAAGEVLNLRSASAYEPQTHAPILTGQVTPT